MNTKNNFQLLSNQKVYYACILKMCVTHSFVLCKKLTKSNFCATDVILKPIYFIKCSFPLVSHTITIFFKKYSRIRTDNNLQNLISIRLHYISSFSTTNIFVKNVFRKCNEAQVLMRMGS